MVEQQSSLLNVFWKSGAACVCMPEFLSIHRPPPTGAWAAQNLGSTEESVGELDQI
jgi:hypothetical protein